MPTLTTSGVCIVKTRLLSIYTYIKLHSLPILLDVHNQCQHPSRTMLGDILVFLSVLVIIFVFYVKRSFAYWKKRGVPYVKPSFPFGNFGNPAIFNVHAAEKLQKYYCELKSQGHKHGGCYILTSPSYIALDPDLIKNIMQKDFHYFMSRGVYYNEEQDPLSAHLFAIEGEKWKSIRHKMTPTFTSGKMKMMFQILSDCSQELEKAMKSYCERNEAVSIKDVLQSFAMDVIGSCAFGLDCNSFNNPDAQFVKMGKRLFIHSARDKFNRIFGFAFPNIARRLGITVTPKETSEFYLDVVNQTVRYREENKVVRKDFMQILIDLKNNQEALTVNEVAAQAFAFFLAGFETSSTTMTYCLFALSENQDIQERVRDEVRNVLELHDGQLTYEGVQEMKYMDQVLEGKGKGILIRIRHTGRFTLFSTL